MAAARCPDCEAEATGSPAVLEHREGCPRGSAFEMEERWAISPDEYVDRGASYMIVPLRIEVPIEAARTKPIEVAEQLGPVVESIEGVEWLRSRLEATYAQLSNLVTAIESLGDEGRVLLVAALRDQGSKGTVTELAEVSRLARRLVR